MPLPRACCSARHPLLHHARCSDPTDAAALQLLEQAELHVEKLERYSEVPDFFEVYDKDEGDSPKLDLFIQDDGDRSLLSMKTFTLSEFNGVWNQFEDHITSNYNTGRGSKIPIMAKDQLFMTVCILTHA